MALTERELTDREILGDEAFDGFEQVRAAVQEGQVERVAQLLATMPWTASLAIETAMACHQLRIAAYVLGLKLPDTMMEMEHAASAAAKSGSEDAVSLILDAGWDVNAPCTGGEPMLSWAAMNLPLVEWLLRKGADPNIALSIKGADPNIVHSTIDYTPLSAAVRTGKVSVVKAMLANGGNAKRGQLMHVAMDNEAFSLEMAQLLLRAGAPLDDIEFSTPESYSPFREGFPLGTPLHYAALGGNVRAAEYLLSLGADPSKRDTRQRLAIDIARAREDHRMIALFSRDNESKL